MQPQTAHLTAEQRIERAHVTLMQSKRFCLFSGVFMVGKVTVSDVCRTASTNGRDVTYGREFVGKLNDKQLRFLIVHEAMHKAYRHLTVWANIAKVDRELANKAMDYVINLQIVETDEYEEEVAMPRDEDGKLMGLLDKRFKGMDTMQVFNILRDEKDEKDEGGGGQNEDDSDCHGDGSKADGNGDGDGDGDAGLDDHDWGGAQSMDEEEQEELQREIDSALREGSMLVGRMKGEMNRNIDELLHPKVDWREALRDFIKLAMKGNDQSTWRRANRRYLGVDVIMPSAESRKAETIVLGIDTSGSVGGQQLAQFLGEVKNICDEVSPETIELMYWDTRVAQHETYRGSDVQQLVDSTKPRGGGGTFAGCVPAYVEANHIRPQCLIMFTDGYLGSEPVEPWQRLGVPTLWCVVGNRTFSPPAGQTVFVEGI